jgi:hypothetical protein
MPAFTSDAWLPVPASSRQLVACVGVESLECHLNHSTPSQRNRTCRTPSRKRLYLRQHVMSLHTKPLASLKSAQIVLRALFPIFHSHHSKPKMNLPTDCHVFDSDYCSCVGIECHSKCRVHVLLWACSSTWQPTVWRIHCCSRAIGILAGDVI